MKQRKRTLCFVYTIKNKTDLSKHSTSPRKTTIKQKLLTFFLVLAAIVGITFAKTYSGTCRTNLLGLTIPKQESSPSPAI